MHVRSDGRSNSVSDEHDDYCEYPATPVPLPPARLGLLPYRYRLAPTSRYRAAAGSRPSVSLSAAPHSPYPLCLDHPDRWTALPVSNESTVFCRAAIDCGRGWAGALVMIPSSPVGTVVSNRLQTIEYPSQDTSLSARFNFYKDFVSGAFDPIGHSLGSTGTATRLQTPGGSLGALGSYSGSLDIPFTLGLVGAAVHGGGVTALVLRTLCRSLHCHSRGESGLSATRLRYLPDDAYRPSTQSRTRDR